MKRIYESITDCLQDYRNTVSRTKRLKITFDNILSDIDHAEQFKIRINQSMLFPDHFDTKFFHAGKHKGGIQTLSLLGFSRLNKEGIFDYNVNELSQINGRNQDTEKFIETETKIFDNCPTYTSPLLNREDLIHVVEHDPRTCKLFGENNHQFGREFLRQEAVKLKIDNIGILMLLDYGLDCLKKAEEFYLSVAVGRLLEYNGKLKEEDIRNAFEFFFVCEDGVFGGKKRINKIVDEIPFFNPNVK